LREGNFESGKEAEIHERWYLLAEISVLFSGMYQSRHSGML
jgi:hypothetical protein